MEGKSSSTYLLLMLTTSLVAVMVLGSEVALDLSPNSRQILNYADDALCFVFFLDFCNSMRLAPNKLRYFFSWGWIDLLSSIPTLDLFRMGRMARVFRIFRVLRALKAARILAEFILQHRVRNALMAITLTTGLLMVIASVGVLHFEIGPEANIRNPEDALWWAAETITTVGYGDKYPVTSEGRLLGVMLMAAGVALMGAYSGFIAYLFLRPFEARRDEELTRVRLELDRRRDEELRGLQSEVLRLRSLLEKPTA